MRHDWIFEVLTDLRSYAQTNGLPRLSEHVETVLRTAREEIDGQTADAKSEVDAARR
jgi:hypothetical protein